MAYTERMISRLAIALREDFNNRDVQIADFEVEAAINSLSQGSLLHPLVDVILNRRFSDEQQTFAAIGVQIGLSRSRVSQIQHRALRQIFRKIHFSKQTRELLGEHVLDRSVLTLEVSVRSLNCLLAERISTIRDLVNISKDDLLGVPNFGVGCFGGIRHSLSKLGLAVGIGQLRAHEILSGMTMTNSEMSERQQTVMASEIVKRLDELIAAHGDVPI